MRPGYLAAILLLICCASAPPPEPYSNPTFAVRGDRATVFAAARAALRDTGWEIVWSAPRSGRLVAIDLDGVREPIRWHLAVDRDRLTIRREYLRTDGERMRWAPPERVEAGCRYEEERALAREVEAHLGLDVDYVALRVQPR